MGGMVAVTVRNSNNTTKSFKVTTGYLSWVLNDPKLFEEIRLNDLIEKDNLLKDASLAEQEHDNYESDKAVKAPYHYGMILIDYITKDLFSYNNMTPLLTLDSINLLKRYKECMNYKFTLIFQKSNGEREIINLKEARHHEFYQIYFLENALKKHAKIMFKGEEVIHDGSIESVLEKIYNINLVGKNTKQQNKEIETLLKQKEEEYFKKYGDEFIMEIDNYSDITLIYPDFKIINSDRETGMVKVLDHMKDNGFELTDYELKYWKEELKK